MFDGLIHDFLHYPNPAFHVSLKHLRKDHPIVNNQDFENGIVKIQKGETLTQSEEEAVKMFKKKTVLRPVTELTYAKQWLLFSYAKQWLQNSCKTLHALSSWLLRTWHTNTRKS